MFIITVEIVARGVLACISRKASGVQARADPQSRVFRPNIFRDESAHGQRCRRFITMNTTGKIDFAMSTCRGAMQCQKANIVFSFQPVDRPPVGLGCSETIIENVLNNDGLAAITAIIQATWIHGARPLPSRKLQWEHRIPSRHNRTRPRHSDQTPSNPGRARDRAAFADPFPPADLAW